MVEMNLSQTEKIIGATVALAIPALIWLLQSDAFWSEAKSSSGEKLGALVTIRNDVRLKDETSFNWNTAQVNDDVFWNESLFTGPKSETKLQLIDGTTLIFSANSLVRFTKVDGLTKLNLKQGSIITEVAATAAPILVENEGKTFEIKAAVGTQVKLSKTRAAPIKFEKTKGTVEVRETVSQAPVTVKEVTLEEIVKQTPGLPDLALATPTSEREPEPERKVPPPEDKLPIEVAKPEAPTLAILSDWPEDKRFFINEPLPLSWNSSHVGKFKVQWKQNEIIRSTEEASEKSTVLFATDLDPGTNEFEWRAQAIADDGSVVNETPWQKQAIRFHEIPKLTSPTPNQIFRLKPAEVESFKLSTTGALVHLDQLALQLEISRTKDFANPLMNSKWPRSSAEKFEVSGDVSGLRGGTYFIRWRATNGETLVTRWSEPRAFQIFVEKPMVVTPPKVADSVIRFVADSESPSFSWDAGNAEQFEVQWSKSADFAQAESEMIEDTTWTLKSNQPGITYARVIGKKEDRTSEVSPSVQFIGLWPAPNLITPDSKALKTERSIASLPPERLHVEWGPHPATQFQLWVAKDQNMSQARRLPVNKTTFEMGIRNPGTYFFQVHCPGRDIELCLPSEIKKWSYDVQPGLSAPAILSPQAKTTIYTSDKSSAMVVTWSDNPKAKSYELEVSRDESFKRGVTRLAARKPSSLVESSLGKGLHYFRVRALAEKPQFNSDWSKPSSIQIKEKSTYFTK